MALTDPKNTLAYHQSRVLTSHRDMSDVPCKAVKTYISSDPEPQTKPESEALWFYGMNHAVSVIAAARAQLEPLPPFENVMVSKYHDLMTKKAVRAFYYLLMICTRESRQNMSLTKDAPKITEKFGSEVSAFFLSIKGGESSIHSALLKSPPDVSIGTYCESLQWCFYNSKWNGGYGGKAWGQVTDCLVRFVKGEFTAEMMLDTIWTLCHNNGPIFNKGVVYSCHSHLLTRVLDVQRSGQIPEMILHDKMVEGFVTPEMKMMMQELVNYLPEKFGKFVDWEIVHALGSVHQYPTELAAQHKLHGASPAAKAAQAAAAKIAEAEAAKQALAKADYDKNWFEVMPKVAVKKVTMLRTQAA